MSLPSIENGFLVVDPPRPEDRRADREVVLLLHGTGGSKDEWRFPQWRGNHWDHAHLPDDRHDDNNLGPPSLLLRLVTDLPSDLTELLADLSGVDFSLSDLREDVRCWTGVLRSLGHTVVNYSQRGPQQKVAVPLAQLEDHVVPIIRDEVLTGRLAGKRVTVLAHSRGGILARAYLAAHPDEGAAWIRRVVTVCSPHHGSEASLALERYADYVRDRVPILGALAYRVLRDNDFFDATPAQLELLPDSPLFDTLAMPADVPDIDFVSVGGTNVNYARVYAWLYAPSSYVPNFSDFPDLRFDWTQEPLEVDVVSPMLGRIPDSLAHDEQDDGRADGLVTDQSARLPGAVHHALLINHNEALWYEPLYHLVAELLGTPFTTLRDVECGRPDDGLRIVPPLLSFVNVAEGESERRTVRVENGTEQPITVSFPASAPRAVFRWSSLSALIPPGEEVRFSVAFHPVDGNHRVETLRIRADDPRGLYALELSGRGVGGIPTGGEPPLPTRLGVFPREIDFGQTRIGRETTRTLTIRNDIGAPVQIHIPASQSNDSFSWPAVHSRLQHGTQRRITLKFRPKIGPTVRSTLLVESPLPSSPVPVALVGRGPAPVPAPGPDDPPIHEE